MIILVYSTADGTITKSVSCPNGMEDAQCGEGEAWMAHEWVDDSQFKVDLATGAVVPIGNN